MSPRWYEKSCFIRLLLMFPGFGMTGVGLIGFFAMSLATVVAEGHISFMFFLLAGVSLAATGVGVSWVISPWWSKLEE